MTSKGWTTVLIAAVLTLGGCQEQQADHKAGSAPATATVSVAPVIKQTASKQVELVGTVQAVLRAEVSAKISGNILTLPIELGSRVKEGDLLVEIDAQELAAQVQQAKTQLDQNRRNLQREENLLKKNASTPQTVKTLQESTRIAEAGYREALTRLDYARVTAPFAGLITQKWANVGDLAVPGKPLVAVEEDQNLQVLTDLPEAMMLRVHKEDRLAVFIPSIPLITEGLVAEVSPVADPSSRSAPIKLRLPPDPRLRSGQFARVTLALEQAQTLTVPSAAVVSFGQMERVFVARDNRAMLRLVRTGTRTAERIEILTGLDGGETVITTTDRPLVDGQAIAIK